jgi:hypothetical protein
VTAMSCSLRASWDRTSRLPGTGWMYYNTNKKAKADAKILHDLCDEVSCVKSMVSMADV